MNNNPTRLQRRRALLEALTEADRVTRCLDAPLLSLRDDGGDDAGVYIDEAERRRDIPRVWAGSCRVARFILAERGLPVGDDVDGILVRAIMLQNTGRTDTGAAIWDLSELLKCEYLTPADALRGLARLRGAR